MTVQANSGQALQQTLDLGSVAGIEDSNAKSIPGRTRESLAELNRKYAQFYRETYLSKNTYNQTEDGENPLSDDDYAWRSSDVEVIEAFRAK